MAEVNPVTHIEKVIAKAGGDSTYNGVIAVTHLEKVIEKYGGGGGGSSADYAASLRMTIDSSTYVVTAQLYNKDGDALGNPQTIDLPLESVVVGGSYNAQTKSLILTLVSGQTITIPIGDIISGLQAEITAQNPLDADLVSDTTSTHKFVTAAEKTQIATNTSDISNIQQTIGNINTVLEEVL